MYHRILDCRNSPCHTRDLVTGDISDIYGKMESRTAAGRFPTTGAAESRMKLWEVTDEIPVWSWHKFS